MHLVVVLVGGWAGRADTGSEVRSAAARAVLGEADEEARAPGAARRGLHHASVEHPRWSASSPVPALVSRRCVRREKWRKMEEAGGSRLIRQDKIGTANGRSRESESDMYRSTRVSTTRELRFPPK
ncbi:hypothetical protein DFH09DRAFT_1086225 [Mycena vulgaris]|nr:hypothetical protein DFH09DRAFT_1086225 [Mycena vulgaris]